MPTNRRSCVLDKLGSTRTRWRSARAARGGLMAPPEAPRELVQHGRFDSPFFRSKFRVPSIPPHFVERDRLARLLDDLSDYPVTALIAPAGAGKTALAADWASRNRPRAAWVTLDSSDRDP